MFRLLRLIGRAGVVGDRDRVVRAGIEIVVAEERGTCRQCCSSTSMPSLSSLIELAAVKVTLPPVTL